MLPLIIGGAVVLGAFAWVSSYENNARQEFESRQHNAKARLNEMSREMKAARKAANDSVRFQKYIVLYGASIEQSKSQYRDYEVYKRMVKTVKTKRDEIGQRIGELKAQRDTAKGEARQVIRDELAELYIWLDEAKLELDRLYPKKAELLEMLRQTNQNTRELKTTIRDKCGRGGRMWYERKQLKTV